MPWELEIHIIDVGQGESQLIIADDQSQRSTSHNVPVRLPSN